MDVFNIVLSIGCKVDHLVYGRLRSESIIVNVDEHDELCCDFLHSFTSSE